MLLCVSANHKKTSFTVLEQLARVSPDFASELVEAEDIDGAAILSTCNRFEVYIDAIQKGDQDDVCKTGLLVQNRIGELCNISPSTIIEQTSFLAGCEVSRHLFSVATGLESMIIGETEIAGQVKRALTYAQKCRTTSPELERLFQRASAVNRHIRQSTKINEVGQSLVSLSLDLASSRIGDWSGVRAIIVGTGKYASKALALLKERGVVDISVYSPSGHVNNICNTEGVRNIFNLQTALSGCDLVVGCSSVDKPVITKQDIETAQASGSRTSRVRPVGRPSTDLTAIEASNRSRHVLIDLGLPRNFDPAISDLPTADLIDLDMLRVHAPFDNLAAEKMAHELAIESSSQFVNDCKQHEATPVIVSFRNYLESLTQTSLRRTDNCKHAQHALKHFVNSLIHIPLTRCKQLAANGESHKFAESMEILFDVKTDCTEGTQYQSSRGKSFD
ncbi:glutamyl-tRNA reductase [Tropheryma whipplei]|uniref:glutamyl-tRNA reductase n=1 Tax=Tropheryma whipplei TaxID=2039 RepID=UPI00056FFF66|nr:glutamyl-tRNA reductase [Tropheryma whipplei]